MDRFMFFRTYRRHLRHALSAKTSRFHPLQENFPFSETKYRPSVNWAKLRPACSRGPPMSFRQGRCPSRRKAGADFVPPGVNMRSNYRPSSAKTLFQRHIRGVNGMGHFGNLDPDRSVLCCKRRRIARTANSAEDFDLLFHGQPPRINCLNTFPLGIMNRFRDGEVSANFPISA